MWLNLTNGHYIKIEDVQKNSVSYYEFETKQDRLDAKDENGEDDMSKFPRAKNVSVNLNLTAVADASKSLEDNLLTAGYAALKTAVKIILTRTSEQLLVGATDDI
jgi:hypothetical protein